MNKFKVYGEVYATNDGEKVLTACISYQDRKSIFHSASYQCVTVVGHIREDGRITELFKSDGFKFFKEMMESKSSNWARERSIEIHDELRGKLLMPFIELELPSKHSDNPHESDTVFNSAFSMRSIKKFNFDKLLPDAPEKRLMAECRDDVFLKEIAKELDISKDVIDELIGDSFCCIISNAERVNTGSDGFFRKIKDVKLPDLTERAMRLSFDINEKSKPLSVDKGRAVKEVDLELGELLSDSKLMNEDKWGMF